MQIQQQQSVSCTAENSSLVLYTDTIIMLN